MWECVGLWVRECGSVWVRADSAAPAFKCGSCGALSCGHAPTFLGHAYSCPYTYSYSITITITITNRKSSRLCLASPSRAISSSHESPRSGVNVAGLRPSLITQHSLRRSSSPSTRRGKAVFSDQRRAQPGKNAFPWRRFAGKKFIATTQRWRRNREWTRMGVET